MSALLKKTHEFRAAAVADLTLEQERDLDHCANEAWAGGFNARAENTREAYVHAADAMREFYRLAAEGRR